MPETIATAAVVYGLPPLETLTAATANPAWVLGMHEGLGTLEAGKRADVLLIEEPSFAQVIIWFSLLLSRVKARLRSSSLTSLVNG